VEADQPELEARAANWLAQAGRDPTPERQRLHAEAGTQASRKAHELESRCQPLQDAWQRDPCPTDTQFAPRVCTRLLLPGIPGTDRHYPDTPDSYIEHSPEADYLVHCAGGPRVEEEQRAPALTACLREATAAYEAAGRHLGAAGLAQDSESALGRSHELASTRQRIEADPCRKGSAR
jgi:hypothetical protein